MKAPKSVEVGVDLKLFSLKGTWEPNDAERKAAWELYVELLTRTSLAPTENGIARESLASLYSLFSETRRILKAAGPTVGEPKPDGQYNFGYLAICLLNYALRPVLSYWHPELEVYESTRLIGTSLALHEASWERIGELRDALSALRAVLQQYATVLATACGVPDLSGTVPHP